MTQQTSDHVLRLDGANNRFFSQPDSAGQCASIGIRFPAARVRTNPHHVNAERNDMSTSETLVSLIIGVCQQDPERWRQFDAIYRPMLMAYMRQARIERT